MKMQLYQFLVQPQLVANDWSASVPTNLLLGLCLFHVWDSTQAQGLCAFTLGQFLFFSVAFNAASIPALHIAVLYGYLGLPRSQFKENARSGGQG